MPTSTDSKPLVFIEPGERSAPLRPLSFFVRPIDKAREMDAVRRIRYRTFSRHRDYHAEFAEALLEPDKRDLLETTKLYAAFDAASLEMLGTMRVFHSADDPKALSELAGANPLKHLAFSYADRFSVLPGSDAYIGPALMKAFWESARAKKSEALMGLAVRALTRYYAYWGAFERLGDGKPMRSEALLSVPYYLVGARMEDIVPRLQTSNPEYAQFLVTPHPLVGHEIGAPRAL